jgi:tetratricopeptide (TPR) repeat protein
VRLIQLILALAGLTAAGAIRAQTPVDPARLAEGDGLLSSKLIDEALVLAEAKDHVGALKKLDDAFLFLPNSARAYYEAGMRAQAEGNLGNAHLSFQQALRAFPNLPQIFVATGYVRRKAGDYYGAITAYDTALLLAPRDPGATTGRAEAKSGMEDYEGAIADFSAQIETGFPHHLERVYLRRGMMFALIGDKERAEADFRAAIKIAPDYQSPYIFLGSVLRRTDRWTEALAACNKAIELKPDDSRAYNARMWAYYELGQPDRAIADATRCLELIPDSGEYAIFRAVLHELLGNLELARADFERAAELADTAKDAETWFYARSHLDLMQRSQGLPPSSDYLGDVLSWPDNWQKRLALHLSGRTTAATLLNDARHAKRRIERVRQECEAHYYAAIMALSAGDKAEALAGLRRCVALNEIEMVETNLAQMQLKRLEIP